MNILSKMLCRLYVKYRKNMNILIHYYRLGHYIGGAEVIALNQCAEFVNQGHNITILTADVGTAFKDI